MKKRICAEMIDNALLIRCVNNCGDTFWLKMALDSHDLACPCRKRIIDLNVASVPNTTIEYLKVQSHIQTVTQAKFFPENLGMFYSQRNVKYLFINHSALELEINMR